ncbi:MAG: hypothetical protein U9R27_07415 [Campylobacterota bacterium]|nr:hypothetical protein [Campylobacterota bacterium]
MIDKSHTPLFVMERDRLETNLTKLAYLQEQTGVKILHTLKSFHEREGLEIIGEYLSGFSTGNQSELERVSQIDTQHIHSYAPAFHSSEIKLIAQKSTTMSFNSLYLWEHYAATASAYCSMGLRINPKLTIKQPKYCNPNYTMRLGVPYQAFLQTREQNPALFKDLKGLHFHVFCGQGLSGLKYLLNHISQNYQDILPNLRWLNLGGGQQYTDEQYDHEGFIRLINRFKSDYPNLTLIFEPGESVIKNTGYFITTILDIIPAERPIVILDTSIEAHLLDIAITGQRPRVRGAVDHKTPYHYQLSGVSCIAGDIIGDWYFQRALQVGESIIFEDMMGYTLVKQTEFNGIAKAKFSLTDL